MFTTTAVLGSLAGIVLAITYLSTPPRPRPATNDGEWRGALRDLPRWGCILPASNVVLPFVLPVAFLDTISFFAVFWLAGFVGVSLGGLLRLVPSGEGRKNPCAVAVGCGTLSLLNYWFFYEAVRSV